MVTRLPRRTPPTGRRAVAALVALALGAALVVLVPAPAPVAAQVSPAALPPLVEFDTMAPCPGGGVGILRVDRRPTVHPGARGFDPGPVRQP